MEKRIDEILKVIKTDRCPICSKVLDEEHLNELYLAEVKIDLFPDYLKMDETAYYCVECFDKEMDRRKDRRGKNANRRS